MEVDRDITTDVRITVREEPVDGVGLSFEITVDDVGDNERDDRRPRLRLVKGGKVEL